MQKIAKFGSQHHKWRHPADMMAKRSSPNGQCKNENQCQEKIENNVTFSIGNRDAMSGLEKRINVPYAIGCQQNQNCGEPRYPNQIFDNTAFHADFFCHKIEPGVMDSGRNAEPAAMRPSEKDSGYEKGNKEKQTSRNYAACRTHHAQIRRHVVNRNGKEQQSYEPYGLSDFLALHTGNLIISCLSNYPTKEHLPWR
jgi:hypothetical protein